MKSNFKYSFIETFLEPLFIFINFRDKKESLLNKFIFSTFLIVSLEILTIPILAIGLDLIVNPEKAPELFGYILSINNYIIIGIVFCFIRIYSFNSIYSSKLKFSIRLPHNYAISVCKKLCNLPNQQRREFTKNDLARLITTETENVVWRYMIQITDLLNEFLLWIILLIILIYKAKFIAFFFFIVSTSFLYYRLRGISTETKLINESKIRETISRDAQIIENGIISLLPLVDSRWIGKRLTKKFRNLESDQIKISLFPISQRIKIEVFIILTLLVSVLLSSNKYFVTGEGVGIIILSVYRSFLSLSRMASLSVGIVSSINSVKYYTQSLRKAFSKDINKLSNFKSKKEDLCLSWGNTYFKIGTNRTSFIPKLNLIKGDICVISGTSGSGKTRFLQNIYRWEKDLEKSIINNFEEEKIIYMPQSAYIFKASLIDNLYMSNKYLKSEEVLSCVKNLLQMGLSKKRIEQLLKSDDISEMISGGEGQRIALARLLYSPNYSYDSLILLDEPTSSLDINSSNLTANWITKLKGTKIIVTHDSNLFKNSKNIKYLHVSVK